MNTIVKNILDEKITYDENISDVFSNIRFTYFSNLNKVEKLVDNEKFTNLRFYYLNVNKYIQQLEISYVHIQYYYKKRNEINDKYKWFLFKNVRFYEEAYYYYYFTFINQIFSIYEKVYLLIIKCFDIDCLNNKGEINYTKFTLYLKDNYKVLYGIIGNYKGSC